MATRPRLRAGTAAAALLVLVLLAALSWLALRRPASPEGAGIRAITSTTMSPSQPLLLAWEGGDAPFSVSLEDPEGQRLWHAEGLASPLVQVPPAVGEHLVPGVAYRWRVRCQDPSGRELRSPAFPLTVSAGDESGAVAL